MNKRCERMGVAARVECHYCQASYSILHTVDSVFLSDFNMTVVLQYTHFNMLFLLSVGRLESPILRY